MTRNILLLTLALTLGAGDSVTLLCQSFCDRAATVADAEVCTHNQPTNQLALRQGVDCAGAGLPAPAVMRDEASRASAVPDAVTSIFVSYEPPDETFGCACATAASCPDAGNPPHTIALRI